jgi:hypothetical protein
MNDVDINDYEYMDGTRDRPKGGDKNMERKSHKELRERVDRLLERYGLDYDDRVELKHNIMWLMSDTSRDFGIKEKKQEWDQWLSNIYA